MNYFRHSQNRRRRKLPHIQRKQQDSSIFWPSFHGALAWMRKNQETIDTAVKLLEIYPSLIQDRSLDVFWNFLCPFFGAKPSKSDKETSENTERFGTQCAVTIPSICVTECGDDYTENLYGMPCAASNLPKVSVIGNPLSGKTSFLRLVKDLSEFSLTVKSPVFESDVCVFLLNHETVSDEACCGDLVLASTLDIPILFVKPLGFKLPSPLPDTVIQLALCSSCNSSSSRFRKNQCGGSARIVKSIQRPADKRSGSSLRHAENTEKTSIERRDSDIIVLLIDGYRKAFVYDINNHDESVTALKENIEKVTKINLPSAKSEEGSFLLENTEMVRSSGNFLSVPDPDAPLSWFENFDTESEDDAMSDTSLEGRSLSELSEIDSEVGLSEKETFYFVADRKSLPGKVVKWPPTPPEIQSEISSVADSPINFYNLDFEHFQTEVDLFDSDSTPELS